ncbi:hypothetical protein DERP_006987 [Dermatophagoides pteronyssinus]|uniref:Uncharacterized protein n=1 Tax=Dermatophagoides pteronyssinus TaxID=6956 RepID=A0ABQ8JTZ5_DERPT|nr:hypothetical protein DERP_006987 [Dermatophagoides pteronyssinus]
MKQTNRKIESVQIHCEKFLMKKQTDIKSSTTTTAVVSHQKIHSGSFTYFRARTGILFNS